uniref:Ig-like domain-containing protein n=1 Tax=Sphaeramia orbicularis TaxID=375764 RepID=A0A673ADV2_9TELE
PRTGPASSVIIKPLGLLFCSSGQGQVSSPSEPLVSLVGHSGTLPCHLHPAADASQLTLVWTRSDLDPRFVLVTSVSPEKLKLGDASLRLSSVRLSDEGTYRCFIPQLTDSTVQLVVVDVPLEESTSRVLFSLSLPSPDRALAFIQHMWILSSFYMKTWSTVSGSDAWISRPGSRLV